MIIWEISFVKKGGEGKQFGEGEELGKGAYLGVLIINSIVCVVGVVVTTSINSQTQAGCGTMKLNSDIICLEIASDSLS